MTAIEPEQEADRLDLTPDPRILEVLGQIPYPPWRCLAELVDNSFDELMLDPDRAQKRGAVHIAVPRSSSGQADAEVMVADNGRGMSRGTLERSLRAGYTGKARYGSLGLFGMGFNIATARLGNRTIVRTTRKGDEHWSVTEIDFREMQRRDSFHVPLRYEAKDDPSGHGTEIIVRDLNPEMLDTLKRTSTIAVVKKRLGRVYSYLLRDESPIPQAADGLLAGRGIALYINGKRVEPWLPCAWSAARMVSYRGAEISAVQVVDHRLADAYACMRCGHWQRRHNADQCPECRSGELELRPRRVHGWLGVQRYLDDSEFGVDFLRNGRRILIDDKTLFTWEDFDTGEADLEYPLEIPNGQGRLIGEIHLDHVPVDYQKTDFKRETPEWREAVVHLRGEGPMREKKARQRGYPENDSLMGRLFKAFQRNDPGLRCLIPGDGYHALHEAAREWGKLFHSGIPEYQTDERWYEAAARHDELKAAQRTGGRHVPLGRGSGKDGLGGRTGLTPIPQPDPGTAEPLGGPRPRPQVDETENERFTRYAKDAKEFYDLAGDVSVAGLGKRKVRVFDTSARLQNAAGTQEVPVVPQAPE